MNKQNPVEVEIYQTALRHRVTIKREVNSFYINAIIFLRKFNQLFDIFKIFLILPILVLSFYLS